MVFMARKGRFVPLLSFLRRTANRWTFWPEGILPLPSKPASRQFAFDRGTPIDRFLIEEYLKRQAADIRGRALEVEGKQYLEKFGGDRVTRIDVLHAVAGNPEATLVGDLATGQGLPWGVFDCVVITQTLHVIYDIHATVKNIHRLLKPGGVALVTVPGISQISRFDADRWGDFWRMTPDAAKRLFAESFSAEAVTVEAHGNVRLAAAYLYGLAAEEIPPAVLTEFDQDYPVMIFIRAEK
jgi:SAM-dependent methyltransferase